MQQHVSHLGEENVLRQFPAPSVLDAEVQDGQVQQLATVVDDVEDLVPGCAQLQRQRSATREAPDVDDTSLVVLERPQPLFQLETSQDDHEPLSKSRRKKIQQPVIPVQLSIDDELVLQRTTS